MSFIFATTLTTSRASSPTTSTLSSRRADVQVAAPLSIERTFNLIRPKEEHLPAHIGECERIPA